MSRDPRIDAYIAKAAPFARPLLTQMREFIHAACPEVEETIKWSTPWYDFHGPLMATPAFKAHARVMFWKHPIMPDHGADPALIATLARMGSIDEMPSKAQMAKLITLAMRLNTEGVVAKKAPPVKKSARIVVPELLDAAFAKKKKAKSNFDAMTPGQRRDYCEWIDGAKRDATKATRVAKAIAQLSEGKTLNWAYASPAKT